jgi:hypothetical protein
MKKRLLIIGLLAVIGLLLIDYAIEIARRPHVLHHKVALMMPATPLAYIQCSHLKTRVVQLMNSTDYRTFMQSEFVKQLDQDERSAKLIAHLKKFWNGLLIDPMRVIGTDIAVGIYKAEEGEKVPGVILISKVDRIAKIAERVLYGFDRLMRQSGMTFEQDFQRVSIYGIHQPDIIFPLYYAIIDDIGMISTSLSLLKSAILSAIGADDRPANAPLFRKITNAIPDKRFVTCYLNSSSFFEELRQNEMFQSLKLVEEMGWEEEAALPVVTVRLDTYTDKVILRVELFSDSDMSNYPNENPEDEATYRLLQDRIPPNLPVVATLYRKNLPAFLRNWQEVFPQWGWPFPIQTSAYTQDIFGEVLECKVSDTLIGTFYTMPDISCVLDTQRPELSLSFLNTVIERMLGQALPLIAQRAFVKMANESYRNTVISKVQFMFQDILSYAVAEGKSEHSQNAYTFLATNSQVVKNHIDSLQAQSDEQPYVLPLQPDHPTFVCWLNNAMLSKFIQILSQTNTFSLLFPQYTHKQLYHILPSLIRFLQPLPPVWIEIGTTGTGLYLELRSREKSHT